MRRRARRSLARGRGVVGIHRAADDRPAAPGRQSDAVSARASRTRLVAAAMTPAGAPLAAIGR